MVIHVNLNIATGWRLHSNYKFILETLQAQLSFLKCINSWLIITPAQVLPLKPIVLNRSKYTFGVVQLSRVSKQSQYEQKGMVYYLKQDERRVRWCLLVIFQTSFTSVAQSGVVSSGMMISWMPVLWLNLLLCNIPSFRLLSPSEHIPSCLNKPSTLPLLFGRRPSSIALITWWLKGANCLSLCFGTRAGCGKAG